MLGFFRKKRAAALLKSGAPRKIRIHSVIPCPEDAPAPEFHRVAFEFLDPPGPWSMQFFECAPGQAAVIERLAPTTEARFYESEDGARTRVLALEDGTALWPR